MLSHSNLLLHNFINRYCMVNPKRDLNAGIFKQLYNNFAKLNISQDNLKEMMNERGFKYVTSGTRRYRGIYWKDDSKYN